MSGTVEMMAPAENGITGVWTVVSRYPLAGGDVFPSL